MPHLRTEFIARRIVLVTVTLLVLSCEDSGSAARPAFDPERYLDRYRGRENVALVECTVKQIERLEEREDPGRRLDLHEVTAAVDRVVWNRPKPDAKPNALAAVYRNRLEADAGIVRFAFDDGRFGFADAKPVRNYFQVGKRYLAVFRGGFYKIQAVIVAAIEIPSSRESTPLDIFERFRPDPRHTLVRARIVASKREPVVTGFFSFAAGEKLSVTVLGLPWGADRPHDLPVDLGATVEVTAAPNDEECEVPRFGDLEVGKVYDIALFAESRQARIRVIAAHRTVE